MSTPFFSIIIPCYNHEKFVQRAIQSVIDQDFIDWEIIFVDDGSIDKSLEIVKKLAQNDFRLQLFLKENGGLSSARNLGLINCRGRFIQFLDSDDYLLPGCLGQVYKFLCNCYSDLIRVGYQYVDEDDEQVIHSVTPQFRKSFFPSILCQNLGPCHSIFIKAECITKIGSFDEELKSAEDWDFWIRAVKLGFIISDIGTPLVAYRMVNNSMSRSAFQLYEAQTHVILRGSKFDNRIADHSFDDFFDYDFVDCIRRQLLVCVSLLLVQNKTQDAVQLYKTEKNKFQWSDKLNDFTPMCSYLTFRYRSKKEEVKMILDQYLPRFEAFFELIDMSDKEKAMAIDSIFSSVKKMHRRNKYGFILGKILNLISQ